MSVKYTKFVTCVYAAETFERIKQISDNMNISVSHLIREMTEEWLEKHDAVLKEEEKIKHMVS